MKVIKQSVVLPAPAKKLYAMYLNARQHAAITGERVTIRPRVGSKFRAFGGALSGRILQLVPGKLIVQTWRSTAFRKGDGDSTLILRFVPKGRSGRVELTHVNVPAHDYRGVNTGWLAYYWGPWRKLLKKR